VLLTYRIVMVWEKTLTVFGVLPLQLEQYVWCVCVYVNTVTVDVDDLRPRCVLCWFILALVKVSSQSL